MDNEKAYWILVAKFKKGGILTEQEADTIARVGSRKQRYWRRHMLDLCTFVLGKLERRGVDNPEVKTICESVIKGVKQ